MKDILLVDGYNVINAWPELRNLAQKNLEHARTRLIDIMANYQGMNECKIVVVFDASLVPGRSERTEYMQNIEVVFSKENETADSVIERMVHLLRGERVFVVTSDWDEQRIIFGSGAYRIPVRQFRDDVIQMEKDIAEKIRTASERKRSLENGLPEKIKFELEKIRRAK